MVEFEEKFHWADYLLFAISFALSVLVGIILAIKEKWLSQSSESYLMANRQMNWFMVAISILATAMSALLFVGFTAEFYYLGFTAVWLVFSYYIGTIPVTIFVIPKFYRMGYKLTSAYSYFQYRFNLPVRLLVAFMYFLLTLVYMSVALYVPSLVLSQVSVINIYWSIFLGAIVCMLYTGFGGMKAVIWVDNLQILVIAIGMLALVIKGSIDAGGITEVWRIYSEVGQRDNWDDIDPAPWNRHNVWNVIFLIGALLAGNFATDQALLQRYMTVPDMRRSQRSLMVAITVGILFLGLVMVMGMVSFAAVGGNEPLLLKKTQKVDQILPYFLMATLGRYHGIPGLVVAAIYAAALSTSSSGQNALAAVFLEDFIKPLYKVHRKKHLSSKAGSIISKVTGIIIGISVLAIGMGVPSIEDNLVNMALSFQSFIIGPMTGLLIVGFWFFWVESWGAFVGVVCGAGWSMMMYFGNRFNGNKLGMDQPPLFMGNFSVAFPFPNPTTEPTFWDVSYTWNFVLTCTVVLVVSSIFSMFVHLIRSCMDKEYGWKQIVPPKEFRYTMDDFKVALGIRKNEMTMVDEVEIDTLPQSNGTSFQTEGLYSLQCVPSYNVPSYSNVQPIT